MSDSLQLETGQLVGIVSGVLGFLGLVLPIVRIDVGAFGIDLTSATLTIWDLADMAEQLGDDPIIIYFIAIMLAVGSLLVLVGVFWHAYALVTGVVLQAVSVLYLLYEVWIGEFTTFGVEVSASPEIGLFMLIGAPMLGIVTVAIEYIDTD